MAQGSRWGLVFCYFLEKRSGQTPWNAARAPGVSAQAELQTGPDNGDSGRPVGCRGWVPGWERSPRGWPVGTRAGGV